ncbi:hypothetical protein [Dactylosporangium sp. CA-233914]|uniref:hypothetical protein n=1 Tax=Dactylosporangium sp. CA-233914 TaxID=3239934 RepID=UPI003D8FD2E9
MWGDGDTLDLVTDEPPRGTMSTGDAPTDPLDVAVDGDSATWRAQVTQPMPLMVEFSATADGDQVAGIATVQSFFKIPFDGKRR